MNLYTMIFVVVLIAFAYAFWSRRQDNKQGIVRDNHGNPLLPSEREEELQSEVEQLRERVKVLERIATDPARRTAEEIEKLRDE